MKLYGIFGLYTAAFLTVTAMRPPLAFTGLFLLQFLTGLAVLNLYFNNKKQK